MLKKTYEKLPNLTPRLTLFLKISSKLVPIQRTYTDSIMEIYKDVVLISNHIIYYRTDL